MLNYIAGKPLTALVTIGLLITVSIPFQIRIDDIRGESRIIEQSLYMPASVLKRVSLGYNEMLADIYWLRALQYFGSDNIPMSEKDPDVLFQYFDIITDLDPHFVNAYRFGGTFLSEPENLGLGRPDLGLELLDKGRENNPGNYMIPMEAAFINYIYIRDYHKAAELFEEASEKPGISDFRSAALRGMAASSLSRGGEIEHSLEVWKMIYNTTENEGRKRFALRNVKEIETKLLEEKLTAILQQYLDDGNPYPYSMDELLQRGYLTEVPRDNKGREFIVAPEIDAVRSITVAAGELKENARFYTSKAQRYRRLHGEYPPDFDELKEFVKEDGVFIEYRPHPFGEDYIYDPETGVVSYDESWFEGVEQQ